MKTETEFLEEHRHEFGGYVLDALQIGVSGPALALFLRNILKKIDARLVTIYRADINPPTVPTKAPMTNGVKPQGVTK